MNLQEIAKLAQQILSESLQHSFEKTYHKGHKISVEDAEEILQGIISRSINLTLSLVEQKYNPNPRKEPIR